MWAISTDIFLSLLKVNTKKSLKYKNAQGHILLSVRDKIIITKQKTLYIRGRMRMQMEKKLSHYYNRMTSRNPWRGLGNSWKGLGDPMVSQIIVMRNTPLNRIWGNTEYGARQSDILDIAH